MRIGIVTQPLSRNYGGILQNYALQQTLIKLGHTPYTFDLGKYTWRDWAILTIKSVIKKILGRQCSFPANPNTFYAKECILRRFVDNYISMTHPRTYTPIAKQIISYNLDAIIVGSDQVWRPKYNYRIGAMYLDFTKGFDIKRIAYAASFGTDEWEYTKKQTLSCKTLLEKFDAISVREKSGVDMCKTHFGTDAMHLLDPTLLLTKEEYKQLVTHIPEVKTKYLFAYILDPTDEKIQYVTRYAENLGLEVVVKGVDAQLSEEDSVENWIAIFRDAQYVITDSFHGSVFSIIFNKPFIALGNRARGMVRFDSLFEAFDLGNRLVDLSEKESVIVHTVDWTKVNVKIDTYRKKSFEFLSTNL